MIANALAYQHSLRGVDRVCCSPEPHAEHGADLHPSNLPIARPGQVTTNLTQERWMVANAVAYPHSPRGVGGCWQVGEAAQAITSCVCS